MFKTLNEAKEHFDALTTKQASVQATLKEDEEGSVQAVFSVFDVLDSDGDIVLASAFQEGQEVAMVFAHDWKGKAIGKGVIRVQAGQAVFDGKFFMDTFDGVEAYKTVKNMGTLQEWSWGFKVTDFEIVEDDNSPYGYKRIIKGTEVYEVSPVLIGANRKTRTLAIKSDNEDLRAIIREEIKRFLEASEEEKEADSLKTLTEESTIEQESEEKSNETLSEALREVARYELQRYEEVYH